MRTKPSDDERRRQVAASLQVGNPGNNARDLGARLDLQADCQIELAVDEIRPYENNPRRATNAKFDDIKESIRTGGLRSPVTVTRRPGESHFIVEAGGNTRLVALQQLWAETRDIRYRNLVVLFRPWQSESHVLTAHLIENEQRGDMTFWDKAAGIVALKVRLEDELGHVLSLRPLEDALYGLGLSVNTATLAHYLFALERLRTLGNAVPSLSGLDVKTLQPRLNALKRYAQSRVSISEDEVYSQVFEPAFRQVVGLYRRTQSFSVATTCEACELALARHLGEPVENLRDGLRRDSRREQERSESDGASERTNAPSVSNDRVMREDDSPRILSASIDSAFQAARKFAESVDLHECVEQSCETPVGYRVSALPMAETASPERQRAWWLLAGVCGQLEPDAPVPVPLDGTFLSWLADPDDAASSAFWAVLTTLRQSRSSIGGVHAAVDAMSTEGQS
ncbi:MAG: ParB N-terminal domain-containing protein [Gammaproteobacteria bacterium]|nr:ParB N-terminal domain-containing protein [Gammaproteobacteria bacterium]